MSNYNQHQEVVNDLMNRMNDKRSLHNIDRLTDLSSDQLDALNKQIDVMNRQYSLAMEDSAAATKHANKSMILSIISILIGLGGLLTALAALLLK